MSSVEEEKSADDVFTEAFETLAKTGEVPQPIEAKSDEPVSEAPVEGESDAQPEAVAEGAEPPVESVSDTDSNEVQAKDSGDRKPEAATPKEPQKAPDQDIIDRLAQAVKDRVQQPVTQPEANQPYEPPPVLTQEDYKQLEAFEKDWPDVAKAMDMRLKEMAHAVTNHAFKEWAEHFRPMVQEVQELRHWKHMQELQSRVEDYSDVRDKVVEWANSQPDYLRGAYQQVIQRGTPEQVQDLINRYRAENAPPPAPAPVAAPPQPKTLSPAVKKAAAALAPVQSKRSNVVRGDDPNDYDGAFEQFSRMQ